MRFQFNSGGGYEWSGRVGRPTQSPGRLLNDQSGSVSDLAPPGAEIELDDPQNVPATS